MVVSWRLRHEVYRDRAPAHDYLAFEGERVIGRMFQITHAGNAGKWLWTVMATGTGDLPDGPPSGVEARRDDAVRRLVEAYERLVARRDETTPPAVESGRMVADAGGIRLPHQAEDREEWRRYSIASPSRLQNPREDGSGSG
jgi:hypothetical protein